MDKRKFQDKDISLLGFGCMRFPTTGRIIKRIDVPRAQEMIDFAYKNGVNYYDTAYIYHMGKSEIFMGEALKKYPRESWYLADKLPTWLVFSEKDVEKLFQKQLKKCGVSYFDFYLVHCLNVPNYKKMKKYKIYEKLTRLKEEGYIKHLGFSFHDKPELLQQIVDEYAWDFAQLQINYLDWELQDAKRQYEICKDKNIPIVVMEPVRGGRLAKLCPDSQKILKEANPNVSIASWAMRYAASFPEVFNVLSGMSNREQTEDNINTYTNFTPLNEEETKILNKALAAYKKIDQVFCSYCRYCMDCPYGVDIPNIFAAYAKMSDGGTKEDFLKAYNAIEPKKRADKCTKCGLCESRCPQQIKIGEFMKKITTVK